MYIPPPSTLPPGSIADTYLRDSGGEGQDRSVASQLVEVQSYCRTHQLILRRIYKDTKSGKSIVGREDFDRMIDDVERGEDNPQGVLLWDYARFARNAKDAVFHIALIENHDITVHSLTDEIPDGEFRDLIRYVKHLGNEAERKKNSAAVKREMHQLVKTTKAMFGIPPRGIKREPLPPMINPRTGEPRKLHKWVPDPDWKSRIQKAFQMKAQQRTLTEIHNETHIFNSINSYRTFFSNEIYIGVLRFGGDVIEDYCEPIVDRATWDTVQKILASHANLQHQSDPKHHPRRKSNTAYLLSGIAFCGRCGSPLWGMTSGQRDGSYYLRYACTRAKRNRDCDLKPIPAHTLESTVIEKLTAFFENPHNLREMIEVEQEHNAGLAAQQKTIARDLQRQLAAVRRSISNITEAISQNGNRKSKALLTKLATLEGDETDLESRLHSVKTETPKVDPPPTPEEIIMLSRSFVARLQTRDYATRRFVVQTTVHQVTANRTNAHVFGTIRLKHRPRESKSPEDPSGHAIITALSPHTTVGALR